MIYYDWHKNRINGLNKRLAAYTIAVQDILGDLNKQACHIAGRTGYSADSERPFSFNDYPQTKAAVERLKQQYVSDLKTFITTNTTKEWRNSNVVQDLLVHKVFTESKMKIDGVKRKHLYQTNPEALKAFQNRRINQQGTLSTTLWKQSDDYLNELERTIGTAIKKGTSAVTLSKQVSKYLQDFDKLKADYKATYGKAIDVKDCEWRAARLARSEINMAYRTAEQTRWQQMDFVLGYEIQLSKTHTDVDICDDLCGRYPKDFVWTGWHPNDKCYAVPILMSEDDFVRWNNGEPVSAKPIDDVPPQFKRWVADNADKIQSSKSLPYFVRDNRAVVNDIIGKPVVTKRDTAIGSNPAAMVDTKNNDNSANFNKQIEEYLGIKPKQVSNEQLAFADISGGIVPLAYNSFRKALQVYYNVSANKEKTAILKSIIANENFKKLNYHSTKENSIFGINMQSFDKALSEKEMPANLAMAKKFVKNKYDVYLLSNPKTITSADFIVSKKGKIFYIEGKKSTGGGAFITRIKDGAKQSDRVAVDLIDYGNTNKLSSDIKSAFVDEANLKELYLFKGGRLIKIERDVALSNNFYKWFAKQWVKNK